MKILFLCGSLEPGKDGVGDYTRRLCGALIGLEQQVSIIALNDRYIEDILIEDQVAEGFKIPVMRLPFLWSSKKRFAYAKEWVDKINPDLLSLQFVPYSFHRKGLPWGIQNNFYRLGNGRKWHIMFHELWVEDNSIKNKAWSFLQKQLVSSIIRKLRPITIHTHVPVYLERLEKFNFPIKALPIFSNVYSPKKAIKTRSVFTIGFFSQFIIPDEVFGFVELLVKDVIKREIEVVFFLIGGSEKVKKNLENNIIKNHKERCSVVSTGFLEANELANKIKECDVGVTPVPRHLLGKSGSVAAFLSNGVPVAAPFAKLGFEKLGIGFFDSCISSSIVTMPQWEKIKEASKKAEKNASKLQHDFIAHRFLSDLMV